MNNKTKIVILHQKHLIIAGGVIAFIVIMMIILSIMTKNNSSSNTTPSKSSEYSSDYISNSGINHSAVSNADYTAGVYSSCVIMNGNPIELHVTIDTGMIHSIEAVNISDSITTMYPLFSTSLNEIAAQVISNNSTENIVYDSESQYTSMTILTAIENAVEKSRH